MPPEYHLESFWTNRFKDEHHFEWLGDGKETIVPLLKTFLQRSRDNVGTTDQPPSIPRTLHVGAGTSTLSEEILVAYREVFGELLEEASIVNTDFSEAAVQQGRASVGTNAVVKWETVDMLNWEDTVDKLVPRRPGGDEEKFAVVVDKSTSDAISCAPDIQFDPRRLQHATPNTVCPSLAAAITHCPNLTDPFAIEPLELLAFHLADLVRTSGIWIALSYSSRRFPFLTELGSESRLPARAATFWVVKQIIPVDAPSGQAKEGVHAPAVQHFVYVLERTQHSSDSV